MRTMKRVIPVAVSLAVACIVTAILLNLKLSGASFHHPVFFYLVPIALLAIVYGSFPALLCACLAVIGSAYFLYKPVYGFEIANPLEIGDLAWFAVLALTGVKCARSLLRPPGKPAAIRSRYQTP